MKIIRTATIAMSLDVLLKGQLRFLNSSYDVVALSGADDHLVEVADRENVKTINVKMERGITPLRDIIALVRLFIVFINEKPTMVHSITPKAGLLSMVAALLAGVPIRVHTFTGLIFPNKTGILQKVLIVMDKVLCKCATSVYPEGEGVKRDLLKYKITDKPLRVLANGNINGVDFSYYDYSKFNRNVSQLKQDYNLIDKLVFVNIGRLVKDKGIIELVRSFMLLYSKNSSVALLLVGSFEDKLDPLPKDIITQIKQHPAITWVGYQSDIRPFIAMSDILVFPSYREGFPNVPLQCGAFKKAMILSNINGCNEIVEHEKNGLLVEAKNEEALFQSMHYLLHNPEKREHFGEEAYQYIKNNFDQKEVWNAVLDEYNYQSSKINV